MASGPGGAVGGGGTMSALSCAESVPTGEAGPWSALASVANRAGANFKAQAALLAASCEEADPAHEWARDRVLVAAAGALEAANAAGWGVKAETLPTATASLPLLPLILDKLPGKESDATLARVSSALIRGMELRAAGDGIPPRLCADLVQRLSFPRVEAARGALLAWTQDDGLAALVGSLAAEMAPFDADLWWTLLQATVRCAAWSSAEAMALRFPDRDVGRRMALHAAHAAFSSRHLRACTDLVQQTGIEDLFPPDTHLLRGLLLCRLAVAGRWRAARQLAGADESSRWRLAALATAHAGGGPPAVVDAARAACALGPAWHRAAPLPAPDPARGVLFVNSDASFRAARDRVEALRREATQGSRSPLVIGVDCEWRPSPARDRSSPACMVQVAGPSWALVIDLLAGDAALREERGAWLGGLLSDPAVLKLGLGLSEDLHRLALACGPACARANRCLDVRAALSSARSTAARRAPPEEEAATWRAVALAPDPFSASSGSGLQSLVETVLGRAMDKSCQTSPWHTRPLTAAQVAYAALDAQILLRLFAAMHRAVAGPGAELEGSGSAPYAWAEAVVEDIEAGEIEGERPQPRSVPPRPDASPAEGAGDAAPDAAPSGCAGEQQPLGEEGFLRAAAQLGIEAHLHRFTEPQLRAEHVASALGVDIRAVAKSLGFLVADRPVVVICAGPDRVHRGRLARLMGLRRKQVAFAPPARCVELFGYAPGSMPPLGHRQTMPVVVDSDLSQRGTILCGGGTAHTVVRMRVKHLLSAPQTRVADVADGPRSAASTPTTPATPSPAPPTTAPSDGASPTEPDPGGDAPADAGKPPAREEQAESGGRTRGAWLEALGDSARLPSLQGSPTVASPSAPAPSAATPAFARRDSPRGDRGAPTGSGAGGQSALHVAVAAAHESKEEGEEQGQEPGEEEEKEEEEPAILIRPMRKRLLKWLRVMGADVQFSTTPAASDVLKEVKAQGRVVVTSDHSIAQQAWDVPVLVTAATGDRGMFLETIRHFGIAFDERRFMSRCAQCSSKHFRLLDPEVVRERNAAPESVMRSYNRFFECADCRKVYWVGEKYREAFDAFHAMASEVGMAPPARKEGEADQ